MRFATAITVAALSAAAQAHFTLNFPDPRGKFDEDNEPKLCGGYDTVGTRDAFPIKGGRLAIESHHATWQAAVLISTKTNNPTDLKDFNTTESGGVAQYVVPPNAQKGEGVFCYDTDLSLLGLSDIKDGANVTIQIVFDGGDGLLYQCADLTLSESAKVESESDLKCKSAPNVAVASAVGSATGSGSGGSPSATATSPSGSGSQPSSSTTSNAASKSSVAATGLFAALAAFFATAL